MFKNLGNPDWWFGKNSFWGALNVKSIGYKGFGLTFGKKSDIMSYLPLALIVLIGYKVFKQ